MNSRPPWLWPLLLSVLSHRPIKTCPTTLLSLLLLMQPLTHFSPNFRVSMWTSWQLTGSLPSMRRALEVMLPVLKPYWKMVQRCVPLPPRRSVYLSAGTIVWDMTFQTAYLLWVCRSVPILIYISTWSRRHRCLILPSASMSMCEHSDEVIHRNLAIVMLPFKKSTWTKVIWKLILENLL